MIFQNELTLEMLHSATLVGISILRENVEKKQYNRVLDTFKVLKKAKKEGKSKIHLTFDGYDNIPDEIYEIPPIREWMQGFVKHVPHFLYFIADHLGDNHVVTTACLGDVEVAYTGQPTLPGLEYIKQGINPYHLPPKMLFISLEPLLKKRMIRGLETYGKEMGDKKGMQEKIELLERMTKENEPPLL